MLISANSGADPQDFEQLLSLTTASLQRDAVGESQYYLTRTGVRLEDDIYEMMQQQSVGGPFEDTIEHISGFSFPDIVADTLYGVEVKTSKAPRWRTTGNSVLESTRIRGVEGIYLLFGRLSDPIDFRWRKYEDCLYDVAVTHSPRYLVDMETPSGGTIFDKMGIQYDEIRSMQNPIHPIVNYYRQFLNREEVWWLDTGDPDPPTTSFSVRLWSNLSQAEKSRFQIEAMVLFPEIFGTNNRNKYSRLASWLAAKHGVVSPSLRDSFSSGGKVTLRVQDQVHVRIPQVFQHLQENAQDIANLLDETETEALAHYWEGPLQSNRKLERWLELVSDHAEEVLRGTNLDVIEMVRDQIANR